MEWPNRIFFSTLCYGNHRSSEFAGSTPFRIERFKNRLQALKVHIFGKCLLCTQSKALFSMTFYVQFGGDHGSMAFSGSTPSQRPVVRRRNTFIQTKGSVILTEINSFSCFIYLNSRVRVNVCIHFVNLFYVVYYFPIFVECKSIIIQVYHAILPVISIKIKDYQYLPVKIYFYIRNQRGCQYLFQCLQYLSHTSMKAVFHF